MFNRKATYVHLLNELGGIMSASGRRIGYSGDDYEHRVARMEAHPHVCFAEGDGDDEEDDEETKKKKAEAKKKAEEKAYSQVDVERIVKDRLKKLTREHEALIAAKAKGDESLAELTARVAELEDGGGEGKGGGDKDAAKELAQLRRELKRANDTIGTLTKEKEAATKSLSETTERYKRTRIDGLLRDGLLGAKAHKEGIADAVELMRIRGKADIDEDDRFTITFDGVPYEDAKEASTAFLKKHPYLAEGMQSQGDAHPRPGAGGGSRPSEKQMESMGVGSLLAAGLTQPVQK